LSTTQPLPPDTPPPPAGPAPISIDHFRSVELKTARITDVREHPNADRLWVLSLDLGSGQTRTIVAGIRNDCPREELLGKTIVIVANLAPAMLRGVESQGMLLAVKTPAGARPLTVLGEAGPGLQVT
jgi:methionine--tRNA ligase beta chain